jgi:hypothetical protein
MEGLILKKTDIKTEPFRVGPSIEEKLFENNMETIKNIRLNEKYTISPELKVSKSFRNDSESKNVEFFSYEKSNKFTQLHTDNVIMVSDLVESRNANKLTTKFVSFKLERTVLDKLLSGCKSHNSKLTGCLNTISSLATLNVYTKFGQTDVKVQQICYHMLANLRPFLELGNLNVGYWAIVLNGLFSTEALDLACDDLTFGQKFWSLAKQESDSIHRRIKENELIENAKLDLALLDLYDQNVEFETGGGVHFAISNLGLMKQENLETFDLTELHFTTSCKFITIESFFF